MKPFLFFTCLFLIITSANAQTTFGDDPEDNCCTYNAINLNRLDIATGNIGKFLGLDTLGNRLYDNYDTYRIIVTQDGSIVLNFTARNDSCTAGNNYWVNAEILDRNGSSIKYISLFNW